MSGKIEALLRGLGQGASAGWNDELAPYVTHGLEKVFGAPDDQGIPRNYAAGDRYADQTAGLRRDNQESLDKYPGTFRSAQVLGALPGAIATGGIGGEGIAANGLIGGVRGAIEGAGGATEGNRATGAAWGALPGAVLGGAGAAAPKALAKIKDYFDGGPMGPLVPAFATANTAPISQAARDAAKSATRASAGIGSTAINQSTGSKTIPPPRRQNMINKEAASGREVGPEEEIRRQTNAVPPPKGYGGGFEVPKTRKPNIPHWRYDDDAVATPGAPSESPSPTTNRAPRMRDLMKRGEAPPTPAPPEPVVAPEPAPEPITTPPQALSSEQQGMQDFERLMAGRQTTPPSPNGEFSRIRERDIGGRPTTPPQALAPDQEGMQALERSRAGMLPPATDTALETAVDKTMGLRDAPTPLEYSGKYRVDLGPTDMAGQETPLMAKNRWNRQDAKAAAARGVSPGDKYDVKPRGQSLFDASQAEPSTRTNLPTQTAETRGLPDSEHPTYDYENYPSGHPMADGDTGVGGEFDLSGARRSTMPINDQDLMTPSTFELDELPPSRPPVASTTKTKVPGRKTRPRDLMKRDD